MRISKRTIGVLSLADTTQTGAFAPEDVRLIELFADQAAIAVENARLLEAERQRADYLEGVTAASTALRAAGNRAEMLPIIVDQLANLLRTPHVGIALLVTDNEVEMRSGHGVLAGAGRRSGKRIRRVGRRDPAHRPRLPDDRRQPGGTNPEQGIVPGAWIAS